MRENGKELSKILGIGLLATQTMSKSFENESDGLLSIVEVGSCPDHKPWCNVQRWRINVG